MGGPTRLSGDEHAATSLGEIMTMASLGDPDALTHGFHPWPARMHRTIAAQAILRFTAPGERVLDPFCGSGTVLLEAMLGSRRSLGIDLNPVAAMLSKVKCARTDDDDRRRFLGLAREVAITSLERVRARERALAKLPPSMLGLYGPHVLKEMAGLIEEIRLVELERERRAMEVVFSSLVVKFSNKRAETSSEEVPKRIRKGLVTEVFARKCEELASRWAALERAVPRGAPDPVILEGDAREAAALLGRRSRADLVLTSPPYGGTYDYHAQHAMRMAWLGLDARALAQREIGPRRSAASDPDGAAERWHHEVRDMLSALSEVISDDGAIVLLMGDAQFGAHRVLVLEQLLQLAPRAGLRPIAAASQPRPSWTAGGGPREEHLVLLGRAT